MIHSLAFSFSPRFKLKLKSKNIDDSHENIRSWSTWRFGGPLADRSLHNVELAFAWSSFTPFALRSGRCCYHMPWIDLLSSSSSSPKLTVQAKLLLNAFKSRSITLQTMEISAELINFSEPSRLQTSNLLSPRPSQVHQTVPTLKCAIHCAPVSG